MFYLDDILIFGATHRECKNNTQRTLLLLQDLGFVINFNKSQLEPSRELIYLGLVISSIHMTLSLTGEKLDKVVSHCQHIQQSQELTVREVASLIGRMSATIQAVLPAPLYYRSLQVDQNLALQRGRTYES